MAGSPVKVPPKVLICGVLPPPCFGHSVIYKMLMASSFPDGVRSRFMNMHFWSYATNKKVTAGKLFKMIQYYVQYVATIIVWRPRYVLYNSSFYPMPYSKDFLFCATGIILGRRVIFHDFGQYVRELYDGAKGWRRATLRWMLRHACGSIVMGERVRSTYRGLMDDARVHVVPGVVEDTLTLNVPAVHKDPGIVNVLYFSNMSRDKGVHVAFDAVPAILKGHDNIRITFAGPLENDAIAQRLENLQKSFPGRVTYMGYIERAEERTAIYRAADIFIFPTLRDVFGLVLLHAMAEGLPIVASREGTIPEILPTEENGLLFPKGNARALADDVLVLASDGARRARMGRANRGRFQKEYTLEVYGRRMINVFREIER
jgi:glycosyltransferase involved in cell wall biosynthesis